jgi:hypothetical protein
MRTAIWTAVVLIILIYVTVAYATLDRRSDLEQINALVLRGIEAVQHRDVTASVSCISPNYHDDAGMDYDRLRIMLAQAMANEPNYIITTSNPVVRAGTGGATVTLHVTLKRPIGLVFYDHDVTLELAKEEAYHMLIMPTTQWRVIGTRDLGLPTEETSL